MPLRLPLPFASLVLAGALSAAAAPAILASPEPGGLSWTPRVTDTWQWQLTGKIDTGYDVDVYDIDLFEAPQATIDDLHAQGRHVVCYFSAGSGEKWRPDYDQFLPSDLGKPLDGWKGERWLDTRSGNVRAIMAARMDRAVDKRCDGIEPDNVEAYTAKSGFPLTKATQIDFDTWIADAAHARGLAVALKNDVGQLATLEPHFDFAVNEQCHQYRECGGYARFTGHGKPVFNAEYRQKYVDDPGERAALCAQARAENLRTLVLPVQLDDRFRYACDQDVRGQVAGQSLLQSRAKMRVASASAAAPKAATSATSSAGGTTHPAQETPAVASESGVPAASRIARRKGSTA
jgi:hypothetical protein